MGLYYFVDSSGWCIPEGHCHVRICLQMSVTQCLTVICQEDEAALEAANAANKGADMTGTKT